MSCWSSPRATIFLSTLSLRRATGYEQYCTHAREISIHALLAESDQSRGSVSMPRYRFLSTLSLRRATPFSRSGRMTRRYFYPRSPCGERLPRRGISACHRDFYPRSPCGERRYIRSNISNFTSISIHALLAESDTGTTSARKRQSISIHALLAESDGILPHHGREIIKFLSTLSLRRATVAPVLAVGRARYFYPRSPCGERLRHCTTYLNCSRFLSTLSLRRATSDR